MGSGRHPVGGTFHPPPSGEVHIARTSAFRRRGIGVERAYVPSHDDDPIAMDNLHVSSSARLSYRLWFRSSRRRRLDMAMRPGHTHRTQRGSILLSGRGEADPLHLGYPTRQVPSHTFTHGWTLMSGRVQRGQATTGQHADHPSDLGCTSSAAQLADHQRHVGYDSQHSECIRVMNVAILLSLRVTCCMRRGLGLSVNEDPPSFMSIPHRAE